MSVSARWKAPAALVGFALLAGYVLAAPLLEDDGRRPLDLGEAARLQRTLWEGENPEEPADALLARQLYGSDTTPELAYPAAREQAEQITRETAATDPRLAQATWNLEGPTNIGGRVLDIAVDPEQPDTIYIAAASGGVWRSTDAGTTFEPAWPAHANQAIGALVISKTGVLYAGTGETGPGGGSMTYGGDGVYRSEDRGATWERVGLAESSRIGRIAIDPADPQRIFVAASGRLYSDGGQRGLYLSEDGGDTWDLVLKGDNASTGAVDVAIDPTNPKRMFAAMWDHRREPDIRRYNGLGSGLYTSADGGKTWARTGLGLFGPHPGIGRIGIAMAPSNPRVVYATMSGEAGAYAGFYRSDDGGLTWTPRAHASLVLNNYVFGWWFGRVWVDPANPDRVFHAGVNLISSSDGGVNWSTVRGVHADQHALEWDPKVPGRVYLGNDGGVYRSDNNAQTFVFGRYQPFSQLYGVDVSEQDPRRQVAGLQDNGSNRSWRPDGRVSEDGSGWTSYYGGDGERTLINPENGNIVYACYQYGECAVSTNAGNTMSNFATRVISTRKNWFTPIEFDPEDPATIYTGGEIMSRSDNHAGSFTVISGDLSNGPGRERNPLFKNYGTLTTIAPAGKSTGVIYAGTDDGNLWSTKDGGGNWVKATDLDLPKAWVTRVEVDKADPNRAYVTYSGFRQGDDAAYVLRTRDGGKNWTDISGNLPKAPLNDVNIVDGHLVVAGDMGVFLSADDGRRWHRVGGNLPAAPVNELRWHGPSETLYAATFGRSLWSIDLSFLD